MLRYFHYDYLSKYAKNRAYYNKSLERILFNVEIELY